MKHVRVVLLLALAMTAGCMELKEDVSLRGDGSGTIELKYLVPEQTVSQVGGLVKLARQLAMVSDMADPIGDSDYLLLLLNPSEERIRKRLAAYADDGLTLDDVKVRARDNGREVRLVLGFKSLAALRKLDVFADHGFEISKRDDGNYVLARRVPNADPVAEAQAMPPETVRLVTPLLAGFKVTVTVKPPGRILRANTTQRETASATWTFDFDRDPNAFRDFHTAEMALVFEGEGLAIPLP